MQSTFTSTCTHCTPHLLIPLHTPPHTSPPPSHTHTLSQVSFTRQTRGEDGEEFAKTVKRTLFHRSNILPQKKVLTFNRYGNDFSFSVFYGDLSFLSEEEQRWVPCCPSSHLPSPPLLPPPPPPKPAAVCLQPEHFVFKQLVTALH